MNTQKEIDKFIKEIESKKPMKILIFGEGLPISSTKQFNFYSSETIAQ
ncbi:hypothetical protein P8864_14405 [Priestia flexa]|nr:hypothetical protein [Priestia flexa]MEC0667067.1 hypothetical protein [Priestia flexa]